jgi:nicotinamidase-related amidase
MILDFTPRQGRARAKTKAPPRLRDLRGVARPALEPDRAALLIIDAQREYMEGPLKLEGMEGAIVEIARLRSWARANGVPVIHVQQVGLPGAAVFAPGTAGVEIISELRPIAGEAVVVKAYPNAFNKTRLDAVIAGTRRRQLILTGFMAHMCLDATARAAFDRDHEVFVVGSATAERAIPGPDGQVMAARALLRATLTALNDRFAWVLPDAASVTGGVRWTAPAERRTWPVEA